MENTVGSCMMLTTGLNFTSLVHKSALDVAVVLEKYIFPIANGYSQYSTK